ncbi:MAG: hypothetical protein IKY28_05540 [Anaerotignum sp.]|nr:hypothetical protein [Anaerotignum sp.]
MNLFGRKQTKKTFSKMGKRSGAAAVLKQSAQPKKLPEELIGYISGKDLLERGYLFFEAERWYSIERPENGVVTVSSWSSTEDADRDGFGMEECYDWWLLDEQLRPIRGIAGFHDFSKNDVYVNREEWARRKAMAMERVNSTY